MFSAWLYAGLKSLLQMPVFNTCSCARLEQFQGQVCFLVISVF